MWAQILSAMAQSIGAPISWLLGAIHFLDGVWLFANGVICFQQGYKFFMIALANQEEVARVVRRSRPAPRGSCCLVLGAGEMTRSFLINSARASPRY
jgi:hypothetical protein